MTAKPAADINEAVGSGFYSWYRMSIVWVHQQPTNYHGKIIPGINDKTTCFKREKEMASYDLTSYDLTSYDVHQQGM